MRGGHAAGIPHREWAGTDQPLRYPDHQEAGVGPGHRGCRGGNGLRRLRHHGAGGRRHTNEYGNRRSERSGGHGVRDAVGGGIRPARVPRGPDAAPGNRRAFQPDDGNARLTERSGRAAREAALQILSAVRAGAPFAAALDSALGSLDERDRSLAHEIAAGVLRSQTVLDRRLQPLVTGNWRRVPDSLRDVLRIGAYQLSDLDRVPAYAAVETSVDLARAHVGARAAGLVNAVLRKLSATREATSPSDAAGGHGSLAATHSHPEWLVERWVARFGAARTRALLEHNNQRPPLVIQPLRWSAERLAGALAGGGIAFDPVPGGLGFTVRGGERVARLPGFEAGAFVVQDPAQARVVQFTDFPAGSLIWDACAAPGGKSLVLAQRHRVIASDLKPDRLRKLRAAADRAAPGLAIFAADARTAPLRAASTDAILLDAPCSATGTLARHPDARWRLSPRRIALMARLQAELLEGVAVVLRPGGTLVYATCSLEPEENDAQVNAFLEKHAEYRRTADDLVVFPPDSGSDGAYAARLERAA
ncbi:MAG: 16S rRNA (cytosine(967)-C(5))-methyltransferase RsmB [Gemmatimonadetes bacterium]|nr:16S rRNA (cytosine(967)-C(5))-methyltransferase RsmB [Gemmatimonadota bacterium]